METHWDGLNHHLPADYVAMTIDCSDLSVEQVEGDNDSSDDEDAADADFGDHPSRSGGGQFAADAPPPPPNAAAGDGGGSIYDESLMAALIQQLAQIGEVTLVRYVGDHMWITFRDGQSALAAARR